MGEVALLSPDEALQRLSSNVNGLTPDQVEQQLRSVGRNEVAHQTRHTILGELVSRSINPLNLLLLSLATASYFLGDQRAAIVIAVMVGLSISLGFIQEHRSNKAAEALQRMVLITAAVRRQIPGAAQDHIEVPIEQLVPGDIVLLSAGDMIPADMRLISAKDLFINQSALTGEAMPLEKVAAAHVGTAGDAVRSPQHLLHGQRCRQRRRLRCRRAHRRPNGFWSSGKHDRRAARAHELR